MESFEERKKTFESKFAHDEKLRFKASARANKLLGLWAAEVLGLSDEAAKNYAADVVRADFEEAGTEDVFRKVSGDLGDRADEATIRAKMDEYLEVATLQVMQET